MTRGNLTRRNLLAISALGLISSTGCTSGIATGGSGSGRGLLTLPGEITITLNEERPIGSIFSVSQIVLELATPTRAVLTAAHFHDLPPQVRELGVVVAGDDRPIYSCDIRPMFPPVFGKEERVPRWIEPLNRNEIPAESGLELFIGLEVVASGRWSAKDVTLTFDDDGDTFTETFPLTIVHPFA